MITIDKEKAMIYGEDGCAMYSIMDGQLEITFAEELSEEEYEEAVRKLSGMIESENE